MDNKPDNNNTDREVQHLETEYLDAEPVTPATPESHPFGQARMYTFSTGGQTTGRPCCGPGFGCIIVFAIAIYMVMEFEFIRTMISALFITVFIMIAIGYFTLKRR